MEALSSIDAGALNKSKIFRDSEGIFFRELFKLKRQVCDLQSRFPDRFDKKVAYIEKNCTLENLRRDVWPFVVERIADCDEEESWDIANLAVNCFTLFFVRYDPKNEEDDLPYGNFFSFGGDFDYFYSNYGREAVCAAVALIAQQPGIEEDARSEIDDVFKFTKNYPEHTRDSILSIVHSFEIPFSTNMILTIEKAEVFFKEKGKPEYFEYYVEIAERVSRYVKFDRVFPISNYEEAFEEFEELSKLGDLADVGFRFSLKVLEKFNIGMTFKELEAIEGEPDVEKRTDGYFGAFDRDSHEKKYYTKFSIKVFIKDFLKDRYEREKIKEFLELPHKHPELGMEGIAAVLLYGMIEKDFPGGFGAYIEFLKEVHHFVAFNDSFFVFMADRMRTLPQENREEFWSFAKRVIKYLREGAMFVADFGNYSPELKELYLKDFEEFKRVVEEGMHFSFQLAAVTLRTSIGDREIFKAYLRNWGNPKFEEYLEGARILIYQAAKFMQVASSDEDKIKSAKKVDQVICLYAEAEFEEKRDFVSFAQASVILGFDRELDETPKEKEPELKPLSYEEFIAREMFGEESPSNVERIALVSAVIDSTYELRKEVSDYEAKSKELRTVLVAMESNFAVSENRSVANMIARVREEALDALDMVAWRVTMGFEGKKGSVLKPRGCDLVYDAWIYKANSSTQLAAAAGALFLALGLPALSEDLRELLIPEDLLMPMNLREEFAAFGRGEISMKDVLYAVREKNLEKILRENIKRALPFVAKSIKRERIKLPGLMAVGTKVESIKSLSMRDFRFVLDLAGMGDIRKTNFQLKHNGKSLVNPPLPSALEEKLLTYMFVMFGAVDPNEMDIQVTMGGRMQNDMAGVVCASNILASEVSVQYAAGAFLTDGFDYDTDVRIMVYDAGVRKNGLPFDRKRAVGRTDRIGVKALSDISQLQVLGTFGVDHSYEGPFKEQAEVYKAGFERLLDEHGLKDALFESGWVYDNYRVQDPPEYHEAMVEKFTRARRDNPALKLGVRKLMNDSLLRYLEENRARVIAENPEEYEKLQVY